MRWVKKPYVLDGYSKLSEGEGDIKKVYNSESLSVYLTEDEDCQQAYNNFLHKITTAINKNFLPIYRMSDGEFSFCLERIGPTNDSKKVLRNFFRNVKYLLFSIINKKKTDIPIDFSDAVKNIFNNNYFKTCYGEQYTTAETRRIEREFIKTLSEIADMGMLAIDYTDRPDNENYQNLMKKMMLWFKKNRIEHNKNNYIPFYFIYVLLSSRDSYLLFENKNILIITSYDEEKERSIRKTLLKRKVNRIDFLKISSNKAMFDKIDLKKISNDINIVLIGAGIGTVNILKQLEGVNTLCIDAGFMLNIFNNESLAGNRIFTKPSDYSI